MLHFTCLSLYCISCSSRQVFLFSVVSSSMLGSVPHAALGCLSLLDCPALPGLVWFTQCPNTAALLSPSFLAFLFVHNITPSFLPSFHFPSLVLRGLYLCGKSLLFHFLQLFSILFILLLSLLVSCTFFEFNNFFFISVKVECLTILNISYFLLINLLLYPTLPAFYRFNLLCFHLFHIINIS